MVEKKKIWFEEVGLRRNKNVFVVSTLNIYIYIYIKVGLRAGVNGRIISISNSKYSESVSETFIFYFKF